MNLSNFYKVVLVAIVLLSVPPYKNENLMLCIENNSHLMPNNQIMISRRGLLACLEGVERDCLKLKAEGCTK